MEPAAVIGILAAIVFFGWWMQSAERVVGVLELHSVSAGQVEAFTRLNPSAMSEMELIAFAESKNIAEQVSRIRASVTKLKQQNPGAFVFGTLTK